jgi:Protein of unknown function (DUF3500)
MKDEWRQFGLRNFGVLSARERPEAFPPMLDPLLQSIKGALAEPLRGVTTDGRVREDVVGRAQAPVETGPVLEAALAFLDTLTPDQRERATFPLDADEWRSWFNIHPYVLRHGVMLEDLDPAQRDAALAVMQTSLSARGFQQARDVMRLNGLLIELTGSSTEYGEWPYFFSFFGTPSADEPWGWQLDGHHLALNVVVVGDRISFTPTFMGSEPCFVHEGPLAGTQVFGVEERAGLAFMRSLDATQASKSILHPSILPDELPPELQHPVDGRMQAGAFRDNAVVPAEGVAATELTDAQRGLLRSLIGTYVGWAGDGPAGVRMAEVDAYFDETHFAWMGAVSDDGPFYYRVLNPVVLIEFDHHPGIVFDNLAPTRHHVHTVVRTPNGGDYGADLLAHHHERFDHTHGRHDPRS